MLDQLRNFFQKSNLIDYPQFESFPTKLKCNPLEYLLYFAEL